MIYKDVVERFAVKKTTLLKYLLKFFLSNLAKPISLRKVFRDLKSQGYAVGKNTIHEYTSYLEESYAIFRVDIWAKSVRKQATNPHKFYIIDTAFRSAMSTTQDRGRVFGNTVFLALRRKGFDLHYHLDQQEVDFYWKDGALINACYTIENPDTRQREVNGLFQAMQLFDYPTGQLITWEEEEEITTQGKKIQVRPLWKFLLDL